MDRTYVKEQPEKGTFGIVLLIYIQNLSDPFTRDYQIWQIKLNAVSVRVTELKLESFGKFVKHDRN